jgi:uncharacterized protein
MVVPTDTQIVALHRKYAPNDLVYNLVFTHCTIVNEIAQWAAGNVTNPVDHALLRAACLLHDIGTYILFDNEGHVANERLYPQHAMLGAKIVLDEGLDPAIASLIETHILMGLSKAEITDPTSQWVLPARDYLPSTVEGELLCYGDRFHSKYPAFNAYDTFLKRLQKDLPIQAARFAADAKRFGVPDVPALAQKYHQPIR